MRKLFILLIAIAFIISCKRHREARYEHRSPGYYYKLLSFDTDSGVAKKGVAWVSATFRNQKDSVFWDSYGNMNDLFFAEMDSSAANNYLQNCIACSSPNDSVSVLINCVDFYKQQFASDAIPFFSRGDSVVKVDFRLKEILGKNVYDQRVTKLKQKELSEIESFFGSPLAFEKARDESGFYWVEKPENNGGAKVQSGQLVRITYTGYFLNGRFLERSVPGFGFRYGTPDQLIKGLNYVIGRINLGESAKIILPSRLAFGENGSANKLVPPFTPLMYEVRITL